MQKRNERGQYSSGTKKVATIGFLIGVFGVFLVAPETARMVGPAMSDISGILIMKIADTIRPDLVPTSTPKVFETPKVEAAELPKLSIEQLEAKLDDIVWGGESKHHVMQEGETYLTFDPPQSWINDGSYVAKCLKRGGKVNQECYSNGPRQIKVPTIIGDWHALYGSTTTPAEARDCAESNDCSKRYFLDRSEYVKGGVRIWCSARVGGTCASDVVKPEVQMLIDLIRDLKGIKLD